MFATNLSLSLSRFSALPRGPRTRSRGARVVAYTDWELHSVKGAPCLSISKALSCDTSPHECKMHKVVLYNVSNGESRLYICARSTARRGCICSWHGYIFE